MSLALYRKYRPGTFAEVIGQEHVTEPLSQAIRNGKVHHAYLFSGPRGCGKTSSARILARSLNCEQGPTPAPCGECDSCVALAPNGPGSLDVIEIDAASHGGVDDARDLRERAFYAPVSSRYKIYIVDEAHMVSREGFNALLKLVEEPPPHLKFVFATTEPEKVIGTIRSRTHHYPFRLIPPRELLGHLAGICAREGVDVDPLVLPLVVRAGAGSARDALSVLDQLLAGAGPEGLGYARAVALLGYTDAELLDEVVDAFAARDAAAVFQAVDRVVESGHDPRRFAADLLERFRDLLILEAVPDAVEKGLLDLPADQLDRMRSQVASYGRAELARAGDILNAGLTEMRGATAPRLLLELVCARLLLPAAAADESSLLTRLERLERRLDLAGPAAQAAPPRPAARETRPASAPPASAPPPSTGPETRPVEPPAAEPRPAESQPAQSRPAEPERAAPPARRLPAEPVGAPPPARAVPASAERAGSAAWPEPARPADPDRPVEQPAAVAVTAAPVVPEAPVTEATAGELDATAIRRVWPEVLDAVAGRRRIAAMTLRENAQVVGVRGKTLTLSFRNDGARRNFLRSGNDLILAESLREVLGVDWRIESLADGAGPAGSAGSAGPVGAASPGRPAPGGPPSAPPGRPAEGAGGYDSFAPGDEALDDDGGPDGPPLPPEEAAIARLQEALGAKVIGEIDAT